MCSPCAHRVLATVSSPPCPHRTLKVRKQKEAENPNSTAEPNPLDGFGIVTLASLFPVCSVLVLGTHTSGNMLHKPSVGMHNFFGFRLLICTC